MSSRKLSLFVANLPWTVGNNEFKKYFSQFGKVRNQNVMFCKQTGFSRGFGFVSFDSQETIDRIFSKQRHVLEGNVIKIQMRTAEIPRD